MQFKSIRKVARMPAVWRLRVLQQFARWGIREETLLIGLAFIIGVVAGLATWCFEKVLRAVEDFYFQPLVQLTHATTKYRYMWILALLPALGGLAVPLVRILFRRAPSKLHGLAGILYALIRSGGKLRSSLGLESLIASSLTIGTGGSAGPEAPIAVIGSSVGSIISNLAGISRRNLPTLIGCGAAAGISAVFDAPIAGVLFAMEVMLRDFSVRTFTPIVISSVMASTMYSGLQPPNAGRGLFEMPGAQSHFMFTFPQLPYFLLLGLVCGALAVLFTKSFTTVEHYFQRLKKIPEFLHPAIGAFFSGLCGVILVLVFTHDPYLHQRFAEGYIPIFADGYPTIRRAIDPAWFSGMLQNLDGTSYTLTLSLEFLALVCALKIVATSFTLGGGGSGGVFAPSLFIGATAGGAVGVALRHFSSNVDPASFALVGMGAVLAATIQAPLMSIILLFELTRNYAVMLPIMLAAVTATAIQQLLVGESLYTLPLRAQGIHMGSAVGLSVLRRISVMELAIEHVSIARPDESLSAIFQRSQQTGVGDFVVLDAQDRYLGLLTMDDLKVVLLEPEAAPLLLVGEVLRSDVPPLMANDTLETALEAFSRYEVGHLAVMDDTRTPKLQGLLSRAELMRRYHSELAI